MIVYMVHRACRVAVATTVATVVAAMGSSCTNRTHEDIAAYCALMPDTIGLYVGNPVTQMGYPIGTVTSIKPEATHVRVDFSVTENRQLPGDVKALIRSPSILADRSLELVGNYAGGPELDSKNCIPTDARTTTGDVAIALDGTARLAGPQGIGTLGPLLESVAVLENRLGDETQITLDTVSAAVRKTTPHANALASLFNGVPWWINTAANHFNGKQFGTFNIAYRPPLFRVQTHDGLALCGAMNATMPGSCADVNGQPYAVDIALLQYVLQQASHS